MEPQIDETRFGWMSIAGKEFEHDVLIRLNGKVKKRKKRLSRAGSASSHTISLDEAQHVFEEGAERIIIGAGQYEMIKLSDEAVGFFEQQNCLVEMLPTPEAIQAWNQSEGAVIGLFHVTC